MQVPTHPDRNDPDTKKRVLVLGRSPAVLETVLQELGALGVNVRGSTKPEQAGAEFDSGAFDLLAIGSGVSEAVRAAVKQEFARRNPRIRLLDIHAPRAVRQIADALEGRGAVPPVDLDAYLARIGYGGARTPDLETLRALLEHHPDAIVFEAIDVLLGRGVDLSPSAVDTKLIENHRGGYCFEHNGLFLRALSTMGFEAEGLAARVRWMAAPGAPLSPRTHMVLRVTVDGVPWLADVGFGGSTPTAPLRMDTVEPQPTGHETFRVFRFGEALLVQARRDDTWLSLYEVFPDAQSHADYEMANWFTSTHPASHFRRNLGVARTTAEARFALRDNRFTVRKSDGTGEQRTLDAEGIEKVLAETFGLPVEPDWRPTIERAAMAV